MLTDSAIQQAVARVVAAAQAPLKVILFGSYARGDSHEDSDLDLLVVERDSTASANHEQSALDRCSDHRRSRL